MTKTIHVDDDVWQELTKLRVDLMHKKFTDTIRYLLFEVDKIQGRQEFNTPDSHSQNGIQK